jgi:alpha-D-ribose 1-methylphosphonate 5-triphosphate synthase subunit PhnI
MTADERWLLELLAAADDGYPDALLRAHGFATELVVGLVRAGLAAAKAGRAVDVTRVRITDARRRALADQARGRI